MRFQQEGLCPVCNKDGLLEYETAVVDGEMMYYPYTCECGFEGKEWYLLKFEEHRTSDGKTIEEYMKHLKKLEEGEQ